LNAFRSLCLRVNEIQQHLKQKRVNIKVVNLGGGLGVKYEHPDKHEHRFEEYFGLFKRFLEVYPGQEIHLEPGRALVAQCGSLISQILYIKPGVNTHFMILDAGMTELIRPALYQAYHAIENLSANSDTYQRYDVVGPICESSDCFAKAMSLPEGKRGDLIAIRTTGAYGETM